MKLELRKFTKFVEKTFIEGGKKAKEPVLMASVAAVFKNPWHGQGFVEDLRPTILDLAPKLGDLLVPELIKEIGSPEKILAYGKASVAACPPLILLRLLFTKLFLLQYQNHLGSEA
ncbi:amino acid synthesis family protein [Candidatus Pelagibacter sp.]|nr:amino acid synthesis family protein [Candidatus Pelagibacter sp.]